MANTCVHQISSTKFTFMCVLTVPEETFRVGGAVVRVESVSVSVIKRRGQDFMITDPLTLSPLLEGSF